MSGLIQSIASHAPVPHFGASQNQQPQQAGQSSLYPHLPNVHMPHLPHLPQAPSWLPVPHLGSASSSQQPQQQQQQQWQGQSYYPQAPGQQVQPYAQQSGPAPGQQQGQVQQYGAYQQQQQQQPGAVQPYSGVGGYGMQGTSSWQSRGYYGAPSSQLQPQQLESVAKDEDPVYGPLGRAKAKVDRALLSDHEISPDLADMLQAPNNEPYAPIPGASAAFRPLRVSRTSPLPDALHQELNCHLPNTRRGPSADSLDKHQTAKMGLFEDLERAWFTVDNKLFLWNYNDGRDFNRYDEQPDTIQSVAVVRPRKDVFKDHITHLLIICTSTKVTLFGLGKSAQGDLDLYSTGLTADTPTTMISIAGTGTGRVFALGANRDMYEFEYASETGWLFGASSRLSVHNRTSGALANWVPSFLSSSGKEGIESFVIDAAQSRLYTLHTQGEIEYFDVSGTNFLSRGKYSRIKSDLQSRGLAGQPPNPSATKIVSIAVVSAHESRRAGVVAITETGSRVYFGSYPFSPLAFRPPPLQQLKLSSQTFYSSGTLLGVQHLQGGTQASSRLTSVIPNPGRQTSARENFDSPEGAVLQEFAVQDDIPSQIWTIAEVPITSPAVGPFRSDGLALSPLPRQATTEARQFLVLATSGLFWAVQARPIDMVQLGLDSDRDQSILNARNTFGKNQLGAIAVQMASQLDPKQVDLVSAVNSIDSHVAPAIRESTAGRSIVYSPRHEGLALQLARLLRPIWLSKVTVAIMGKQALDVPVAQLLKVKARLEQLRTWQVNYQYPRHSAEGDAKLAWDQEELSLHGLTVLLKQSIEAINFILLLSDHKLPDIVARCDPQLQSTLANLTYQALFTSVDGREIAKKLVTSLIELQIGQELSVDELSERLQQTCGTFCQPGDVVQYKAEENMRRAESSRNAAERAEALSESFRLFTKAAGTLPTPRLQEVTKRYRALQYTVGAVELPLKCAMDLDPTDKAQDYVQDGRHPSDPRKALYDARSECYECVIEALGSYDEMLDQATAGGNSAAIDAAARRRNEAYSLAIASDDELFHYYLYDWTVARGMHENLLEFDTPYIERYLQTTSNDLEDRRDLLWKFYARREEWLAAAYALNNLATRPSPMNLQARMSYLAQALTSAKSASNLSSDDVAFINSLQDRIEVTEVQLEVAQAVQNHPGLSDAERANALSQLNANLLGLDDLWHSYAAPFRLLESLLSILKVSDNRVDNVCEAVWTQLLAECPDPVDVSTREKIVELCRRFYPSEAAPLGALPSVVVLKRKLKPDIVLPIVFAAVGRIPHEAGMGASALLEGGVPLREVWEAIRAMSEAAEGDREFLAEEAATVFEHWLHDRHAIPAAEVETFASAYLLRGSQGSNGEAEGRREETRRKMQAAKTAATRF